MGNRLALDIETVSPSLAPYEQPPDFSDPQYFELLGVALAYEAPDRSREDTVLFRTGTEPVSELDLIAEVCEWIEDHSPTTCLTFGGASFDLAQLRGRAEAAAVRAGADGTIARRIDGLLSEDLTHIDLQPAVWASFGEYTRLEDACERLGLSPTPTYWAEYNHGIDLDAHRPGTIRGTSTLLSRDIPLIGDRFLSLAAADAVETITYRSLRDMLEHYARSDVEYLFDIADARPFE